MNMKLENNLSLERCPHCSVSKPNLPHLWSVTTENHSGRNTRNWKIYKCGNCGGLITAYAPQGHDDISQIYPSKVSETFDFQYLSGEVLEDFQEALNCYSNNCFNAFASMCRRTIQSLATQLGSEGKDKVTNQLENLKNILEIDSETFTILEQIIIAGHDGAHPHLPKLSPQRATLLLELMKDVLYQLYIRKVKIEESIKLRQKTIEESKSNK
jgi:hypothetical protein